MIFWRGYGYLPLVFGLAAAVIGANISPVASVVLVLLAAAVNAAIGYALNRPLRAAGAPANRLHSMFGMAMEYWSVALVLYALFGIALITQAV